MAEWGWNRLGMKKSLIDWGWDDENLIIYFFDELNCSRLDDEDPADELTNDID